MYKQLLYDEKDQSAQIYRNGFSNDLYNRREAFLIAKYMRHVLGYKDTKLKRTLIEFCKKSKGFNEVIESSFVKEIVRNSKHDFIVRSGVGITKEEIERAKLVKNFQAQKVYISLLGLAKKNKSNFVSLKNWTSVKRIASLDVTNLELGGLFHVLYKNNLIYPIRKKGSGGQKLLYIDWEGEPVIEVKSDKEFYELGKTYEKYCGGYLQYCLECGVEFIRNSSNQKLCKVHSIEKEKKRRR